MSGRQRSRNIKHSLSTKKKSIALSMEKENLERTRLLRSQALNSSGQFLYDKTNMLNVNPPTTENSPIDTAAIMNDGSENKIYHGKNSSFTCSPWEGSNPLIWGRSTDSMVSRISSQRKRAQWVAQANYAGFGNKSGNKSGHHRGLMSEESAKARPKFPIVSIFAYFRRDKAAQIDCTE